MEVDSVDRINDVASNENAQTPKARGMPKSGRWWKKEQKQRHSAIVKVKSLKVNQSKNRQERLRKQMVKAKEAEIRDAIAAERSAKLLERKEREERRKANERKGEVVQVIRNTTKLMHTKNKKKKLRGIEMRDTN